MPPSSGLYQIVHFELNVVSSVPLLAQRRLTIVLCCDLIYPNGELLMLSRCEQSFSLLTPTITGEQGLRSSQMRVQHQNRPKPRRPDPANPVNGDVSAFILSYIQRHISFVFKTTPIDTFNDLVTLIPLKDFFTNNGFSTTFGALGYLNDISRP